MTQIDRLSGVFAVGCMAAFAGGWWFGGIYIATALLMTLFTAHVAVLKLLRRKVPAALLFGWGLVVLLGGLTLLLRDKTFIQLKTTIVYAMFGTALLLSDFVAGKNLPRLVLHTIFDAPQNVWRRVSIALALFFYALAACNLLVARFLSEGAWVGVKTFGFPTATFLFALLLAFFLMRYEKSDKP